jgi:NAD(P)H-quinone oxidoreductase subunit 5
VSAALVFGSAAAWHLLEAALAVPTVALLIVAFGLAPLLWAEQGATPALLIRGATQVIALTQLYLLWHLLFAGLSPAAASAGTDAVLWVLGCFAVLYGAQVWLRCFPGGRFARSFYPWAYCGFYLDETFTRLTFRIWPVKFSPVQAQTLVNRSLTFEGELK